MVLSLSDITEQTDFQIIALRSDLHEYKLAYLLNLNLKIQLTRRKNDLDLVIKKRLLYFPAYEFLNGKQKMFYLLKNSISKNMIKKESTLFGDKIGKKKFFLARELSYFDFFIKLKGYETDELVEKIRRLKHIQIVNKIEPSSIKSINYLIF